jgi:lipoprotein-anchoring transpeptidase ErfK/SrfK
MTTREYLFEGPSVTVPPTEEPPKPRRNIWKIILYTLLSFLGFIGFIAFSLYILFFVIPNGPEVTLSKAEKSNKLTSDQPVTADIPKINKDIATLEKKIDRLTNQGPYLLVNSTENKFYLFADNKLIRQGMCSTGKNEVLIYGKKKTYFKSPRGVHTVLRKQPNPVWARPDWDFIENGEPIPPPGDPSRFDNSTLGAYKLEIGNGYMVHGTIWKRLMGKPVTHGCIRLGDDDLEAVYTTLQIGSKVIIY